MHSPHTIHMCIAHSPLAFIQLWWMVRCCITVHYLHHNNMILPKVFLSHNKSVPTCDIGPPKLQDYVMLVFPTKMRKYSECSCLFSVTYIYMLVQQCYIYWWSDHTMHQQLELNIKNSFFPQHCSAHCPNDHTYRTCYLWPLDLVHFLTREHGHWPVHPFQETKKYFSEFASPDSSYCITPIMLRKSVFVDAHNRLDDVPSVREAYNR